MPPNPIRTQLTIKFYPSLFTIFQLSCTQTNRINKQINKQTRSHSSDFVENNKTRHCFCLRKDSPQASPRPQHFGATATNSFRSLRASRRIQKHAACLQPCGSGSAFCIASAVHAITTSRQHHRCMTSLVAKRPELFVVLSKPGFIV